MCVGLPCRVNATATDCVWINGIGAAEGTTCGSGQVNQLIFFYHSFELKFKQFLKLTI